MPESKRRKNRNHSAQQGGESSSGLSGAEQFGFEDLEADDESLPGWYKVTMFGLMILGLLWVIIWYVTSGDLPISVAGGWNIIIGFSIAMVGFFMTMRWK
ncbi:cell division protein CrgA [Nesterenkonia ebinurensis]|uniref:cell division protein CrgA n=1 Tax=Nesterenkonia ebinurensis TaxID=2608252 RepID=UPI001CC4B278|nr:cell division protein CrgA [Nesterenkonia ebinurensis]